MEKLFMCHRWQNTSDCFQLKKITFTVLSSFVANIELNGTIKQTAINNIINSHEKCWTNVNQKVLNLHRQNEAITVLHTSVLQYFKTELAYLSYFKFGFVCQNKEK